MRNRLCVRLVALLAGVVIIGAACSSGSSGPSSASSTTTARTDASTTSAPPGGWPKVEQPGVTDSEIRVSGVASTTNPLGGLYGTSFDGVQAYFDMINSQGGIYGRKLVMVKKHDDNLANNQREVEAILDQDNVFAVLPVATIAAFSGAKLLEQNKIPTFGWGINDEWTGPPNFFGHLGALCNGADCPGIILPWLAYKLNKHRIGVLAYTVPASKDCLDGTVASFKKYGKSANAEIAYQTSSLSFGVTDLSSDVKKMIDNKVDFITTCMDSNGVLTLAKEMRQQGLNALQYLPNGYDHDFMKKNAGFFQNSIVITQIAPLETKPQFPALEEYVKWMGKAGAKKTENAEIGWVNAAQFVNGLKAAGPNFTRQKLVDAINQENSFDANGMVVPIDWTKQHTDRHYPLTCQGFTKIKGTQFVPTFSEKGKPFLCWKNPDSTNSVTAIKPTSRL